MTDYNSVILSKDVATFSGIAGTLAVPIPAGTTVTFSRQTTDVTFAVGENPLMLFDVFSFNSQRDFGVSIGTLPSGQRTKRTNAFVNADLHEALLARNNGYGGTRDWKAFVGDNLLVAPTPVVAAGTGLFGGLNALLRNKPAATGRKAKGGRVFPQTS
jgi:hypothetical protein